MRAELPDVEHVLTELNSYEQIEAVRRGEQDLGFIHANPVPDEVHARDLLRDGAVDVRGVGVHAGDPARGAPLAERGVAGVARAGGVDRASLPVAQRPGGNALHRLRARGPVGQPGDLAGPGPFAAAAEGGGAGGAPVSARRSWLRLSGTRRSCCGSAGCGVRRGCARRATAPGIRCRCRPGSGPGRASGGPRGRCPER
ncbi:hypothetical protein G6F22_017179 [Rhizopus arrhizus]|nr:hypothetical protein G6F22_017179 [Rhizopus arrhizus]